MEDAKNIPFLSLFSSLSLSSLSLFSLSSSTFSVFQLKKKKEKKRRRRDDESEDALKMTYSRFEIEFTQGTSTPTPPRPFRCVWVGSNAGGSAGGTAGGAPEHLHPPAGRWSRYSDSDSSTCKRDDSFASVSRSSPTSLLGERKYRPR